MEYIQALKRITDIMHGRSVQIFREKKALLERGDDALRHQIGEGRDIMSILRECSPGHTRRVRWSPRMLTQSPIALLPC